MIAGVIAAFVIMICLPFGIAYIYYRQTKGVPLVINQTRKRDVRYFGHSFRKMMRKATVNTDTKTIRIREEEKYLSKEDLQGEVRSMDSLILSFDGPIRIPKETTYVKREIYGTDDIIITGGGGMQCRAICSDRDICIEKNLMLERWMDAEGTITVKGDCDLGINTAAGKAIHLEGKSVFRRLYAPCIQVGEMRAYEKPVIPKNAEKENIISDKGVEISDGAQVHGSIQSHRFVKIGNNATVSGNLFADGGIVIGDNAHIMGNVFSQENIFLGHNVTIGQEGKTRSIIARGRIHLSAGDKIYGFASCEQEGEIMSRRYVQA